MVSSGIELGGEYKDRNTPFVGVATLETLYENGCIRVILEPTELKDGEPIKGHAFDFQQLEPTERGIIRVGKIVRPKIPLKTKVREKITGLEGTVIAVSTVLGDLPEIGIQPYALKPNGEVADAKFFPEGRIEVIKTKKPKAQKDPHSSGGPQAANPPTANDRSR